ncbi:MAG: sugar phosphate isomerase/epimerase, partial [Planctomycetota bacterium]|nr:sugar phosphate isomerase/epimerase [Planctomycetota bacterium]
DPPRQEMRDHHRVYPGDGVAPIKKILQNFRATGASPVLSLELFNRDYWKQDVNEVAKTGLMKMKKAVAEAMSNE